MIEKRDKETNKIILGHMSMENLVNYIEANGNTFDLVEQTVYTTIREDIWGLNEQGVYTPLGKLRLPILVGTADFDIDGKVNQGITVFDRDFYDGLLPPTKENVYGRYRNPVVPCTWDEHDRNAENIVYFTDKRRIEIEKSDLRDKRLAIMTDVSDRPDLFVREHVKKYFDLYDLVKGNHSDSDTLHLVKHSWQIELDK